MHARCGICSDLFDCSQTIAATPCGHTFHTVCLAQWLEQSKTCPHCRLKTLKKDVIQRLFFDVDDIDDDANNAAKLRNELDEARAESTKWTAEKTAYGKQIEEFELTLELIREEKTNQMKLCKEAKSDCDMLKRELKNMQAIRAENVAYKAEVVEMRKKLNSQKMLKAVIDDATRDVSDLLRSGIKPTTDDALKWYSVTRIELKKSSAEREKMKEELESLRRDNRKLTNKLTEVTNANKDLEIELNKMEEERENFRVAGESTPSQKSQSPMAEKKNDTQDWITLSPEFFPEKPSKKVTIVKRRDNAFATGTIRIASKRHLSDSSLPKGLGSSQYHFNGFGGCSKHETPFPKPKAKIPKLSLDKFITLE